MKKLLTLLLVLTLALSNLAVVSAEDATFAYKTGSEAVAAKTDEVQIVDIRSAVNYAKGHLNGSISVPLFSAENKLTDDLAEAFKLAFGENGSAKAAVGTKTIYVLCNAGKKGAEKAIGLLKELNYAADKLFIIEGGAAGTATDTSVPENLVFVKAADALAADGVIVDVRSANTYKTNGHIEGSLHQPLFKDKADGSGFTVTDRNDDLATAFNKFIEDNKALLTSKNVYILCNGGASGAAAAQYLFKQAGFSGNIFTIEGGAKNAEIQAQFVGGELLIYEPKVELSNEATGAEAIAQIGKDNVIFLDLRAAVDYAAGHIKDSVSAPVCLSAADNYKVPVSNKTAFVAQMKELGLEGKTLYLSCYAGTFCVNYAADWLLTECGVSESQLVRVLGGTFANDGVNDLAAASIQTSPEYALAADGTIIDVRATETRYANGYVDGSIHLPLFTIGEDGKPTLDGKNFEDDLSKAFLAYVDANKEALAEKPIYILCNSGRSGATKATALLAKAGITNVFTIDGGAASETIKNVLVNDYLPVEPTVTLSNEMKASEALTHVADENAIFLDLRAAVDFEAGHVKGSVSAPVCLSAADGYKVPVANKEAFIKQMKELDITGKTLYLSCYAGTFCVNYAADWLLTECGATEDQLVRVLGGTFGDKDLAAASVFVSPEYALAADGIIIDVRAAERIAAGYLEGSLTLPLFTVDAEGNNVIDVADYEDELSKAFLSFVEEHKETLAAKKIFILCNSGSKGATKATALLAKAGIEGNVFTIEGGAKNQSIQDKFVVPAPAPETTPDTDKAPQTGDATYAMVYVAIMLAAVVVVINRKKAFR